MQALLEACSYDMFPKTAVVLMEGGDYVILVLLRFSLRGIPPFLGPQPRPLQNPSGGMGKQKSPAC